MKEYDGKKLFKNGGKFTKHRQSNLKIKVRPTLFEVNHNLFSTCSPCPTIPNFSNQNSMSIMKWSLSSSVMALKGTPLCGSLRGVNQDKKDCLSMKNSTQKVILKSFFSPFSIPLARTNKTYSTGQERARQN